MSENMRTFQSTYGTFNLREGQSKAALQRQPHNLSGPAREQTKTSLNALSPSPHYHTHALNAFPAL